MRQLSIISHDTGSAGSKSPALNQQSSDETTDEVSNANNITTAQSSTSSLATTSTSTIATHLTSSLNETETTTASTNKQTDSDNTKEIVSNKNEGDSLTTKTKSTAATADNRSDNSQDFKVRI